MIVHNILLDKRKEHNKKIEKKRRYCKKVKVFNKITAKYENKAREEIEDLTTSFIERTKKSG